MNHITKQIITELKQALKNEEPTITGQAIALMYHEYTKRGKLRKGDMLELIDGSLLRIGRFYVIREDDAPENPPTPKGFDIIKDIIKDIEQAVQ